MNKIAVQTGGIEEHYGVRDAYRMVREWGFDAVDANIDHLLKYSEISHDTIPEVLIKGGRECMELFRPWADAAKEFGVDNYQAHAPFPSYVFGQDGINERMIEVLKNMIRGCETMNCRNLIIHPFFAGYNDKLSDEDEWDLNVESYSKLIPVAKECGVTVCLENMFSGYRRKIYAACCSDIDVACKYIDTLNSIAGSSDTFGFCLDTGHLLLVGLDIKQAMLKLGSRISAFHIHDNDGWEDQHLAPFMGRLDWNRFAEGLRAIKYDKTLSFETFNVWNQVDAEVMPEMMRFIAACGRMLARKAAL
ncbi:MAG: sugar phosphate isomerase/epimerase [Clostridia bacterium]|nr:sugar phosphate isomerase/epimerase [Clostridia bacterium]